MGVEVSLDDVLARHNVGISGAEFLAELDADLSRVTDPAAAPLSAAEVAFLREHAGPAAVEVLGTDPAVLIQDARRAEVARMTELVAGSLGIAEAALLLGVDRSRVSQRLSTGSLWSFRFGRGRRLPRWQFTLDGRSLPGLDVVVAAIPAELSPESVAGFMGTPQPELEDRTPVAHLAGGGEPAPVAELVAGLGLW
ncbi:hypothetical protein [Propionicimonas sp. T2.31MG-18]|uniref:hypothetical protein n=1 Tax=Propionicimonas sp. T2.31MG-18 TaxID=3157620 RepID=UPI00366F2D0F